MTTIEGPRRISLPMEGKGEDLISVKAGSKPDRTVTGNPAETVKGPSAPPERSSPLQLWAGTLMAGEKISKISLEATSLLENKNLPRDTRNAISSFLRVMSGLTYDPLEGNSGKLLKCLVSSGIFWEHKVSCRLLGRKIPLSIKDPDLKGSALLLLRHLEKESSPSKAEEPLLVRLIELLQMVEKDQQLNLFTLSEGLGWHWSITGEEGSAFKRGEIFGKKEKGEEFRLYFSLDFSNLGQVEVDLSCLQSSLNIQIFLKNESFVQIVQDQLQTLKKTLLEAGFEVRGVSCDLKADGEFTPPFCSTERTFHIVL